MRGIDELRNKLLRVINKCSTYLLYSATSGHIESDGSKKIF